MAARLITVEQSTIAHAYAMSHALREDDELETKDLGVCPRKVIRLCYRDAIMRRTYFVDGQLAAMTGICGNMLDDVGLPYLFTTAAVETVPIGFAKAARKGVLEMLTMKRALVGHVSASYLKSCRLLEMIGFTLGESQPIAAGWFRECRIERGS